MFILNNHQLRLRVEHIILLLITGYKTNYFAQNL
jgi:hypothetical protein